MSVSGSMPSSSASTCRHTSNCWSAAVRCPSNIRARIAWRWASPRQGSRASWRASLRNTTTGQRYHFGTLDDLFAFLDIHLGDDDGDPSLNPRSLQPGPVRSGALREFAKDDVLKRSEAPSVDASCLEQRTFSAHVNTLPRRLLCHDISAWSE